MNITPFRTQQSKYKVYKKNKNLTQRQCAHSYFSRSFTCKKINLKRSKKKYIKLNKKNSKINKSRLIIGGESLYGGIENIQRIIDGGKEQIKLSEEEKLLEQIKLSEQLSAQIKLCKQKFDELYKNINTVTTSNTSNTVNTVNTVNKDKRKKFLDMLNTCFESKTTTTFKLKELHIWSNISLNNKIIIFFTRHNRRYYQFCSPYYTNGKCNKTNPALNFAFINNFSTLVKVSYIKITDYFRFKPYEKEILNIFDCINTCVTDKKFFKDINDKNIVSKSMEADENFLKNYKKYYKEYNTELYEHPLGKYSEWNPHIKDKEIYSINSIIFYDYIKDEITTIDGKNNFCGKESIKKKKTLEQILNDMSFPRSVYNNIINSVKNIKYDKQTYWDILNIKEYETFYPFFNEDDSYFEFSNTNLFSDNNDNFKIKSMTPVEQTEDLPVEQTEDLPGEHNKSNTNLSEKNKEKIQYCINKMNELVNEKLHMERCRKLLYIANYNNRTNTVEGYGNDKKKIECDKTEHYFFLDCRYEELNYFCWSDYNKIPNDFKLNNDKLTRYELKPDKDLQQ